MAVAIQETVDPSESPPQSGRPQSGNSLQIERLVSEAPPGGAESHLLRLFIDRAPAAIAMFDNQMRYIAASRRFVTDLGLAVEGPEALIGRSHYEVIPEVPERWRAVHRRVLAGESLSGEEEPFERSDGRTDWVRWDMTPWHLPDGSVGGATLFAEVTTERKEAEQGLAGAQAALRASEQHLKIALETAHAGAYDWDMTTGQATWTEGHYRLMGLAPYSEPASYELWRRHVHPEDLPRVEAAIHEALRTKRRHFTDYRLVGADGCERWVAGQGIYVEPVEGKPHFVGITVDITERKRNEEALKAQRDQLTRITSSVGALITQCSRDLRYVFMNKTYADFIGQPAEQIMGRPIVEVIGEAALQTIRPHIERVLAGERVEYETEIPDAMRVPHRMHVVYAPDVDSQGTVIGWIGTLNDITDRRRAEQKLREKEQFLAMLAHELRNPLTPISAGVELLQHTDDAQLFQSTLSLLGNQVAHIERLLDDLLDVSRVTLGKVELKLESLDVRAVAEHAVQTARALIENREHRVTLALPREPLYVRADAVRLAQVLGNLLNNACKYMDRGGEIAVTVERVRDQALISVRDQGIGFASEDIGQMFELFAQLDTSRQRSVGGLGVGLTLARDVVELHGGTLEAHSEGKGQGSEFVVRLRRLTEEPQEREPEPVASHSQAVQRRVLIIDDRPEITQALTRLLKLQGHVTRVVHEGLNGVQAAQEFRPEIVLLDIGLPDLDGYDTCRRLRGAPGGKDLVLVALSGYGQAVDVKDARAAGFDHYLLKPVHYQTLAQIVAGECCDEDKMGAMRNEAS